VSPARLLARDPAILAERLDAQLLGAHGLTSPAEVVAWMGAIQAQDFGAARWAVGVRLRGSTDDALARAVAAGELLRTHLFRGTWQLVTPGDVRWMLDLVGPRVLAARGARERRLGLDAALLRRSLGILERALAGGRHLTRDEAGDELARGGVAVVGVALAHVLQRAELVGLLASGTLRGRTPTFALLDGRAPQRARLHRAEALRELALRHARGRGPVTAADLAWWAGITLRDARDGLEAARPELGSERVGEQLLWRPARAPPAGRPAGALLLPAFDEYLVGYRDRTAALAPEHVRRVNDGGGMLSPCVVVAGRVLGVWRRTVAGKRQVLAVAPFEALTATARRWLAREVSRYAAFTGLPAQLGLE
jgi:hypothetical protein